MTGLLIRKCATCGHFHSRLRGYCLEPKCMCPPAPKWRKPGR